VKLVTAQPVSGAARELGTRLRELRESHFGFRITQRALGEALGGSGGLSAPMISSWEKGLATPARKWISAYARFFATTRSTSGGSLRLLDEDELTPEERALRESLQRELSSLRSSAARTGTAGAVPELRQALGGPWQFADGAPIRIVCGEIPVEARNPDATPTHPTLPYGELYLFGNLDALVELHGHIRASNPRSDVRVLTESQAEPDDLASHLVVLGGPDGNPLARRIPELLPSFPLQLVSDGSDPRHAYYDVFSGSDTIKHSAVLSEDDDLEEDVGLFVRAPNPANRLRTLTICCGMYSIGTWAVVRTLTDEKFRDRNSTLLDERLARADTWGILMRILVLNGNDAVTPDWTVEDTRLYEWPEAPHS
jgi:Helix-turn-helix domain